MTLIDFPSISHQHDLPEELAEQHRHFSGCPRIVLNRNLRILHCSSEFLEVHGVGADELIGMRPAAVLLPLDQEDSERVQRSFALNQPFTDEISRLNRDGEQIHTVFEATPFFDVDDMCAYWLVITTKTTVTSAAPTSPSRSESVAMNA